MKTDSLYHCPVCGKIPWSYVYRDKYEDVIGCDNCVEKISPDELMAVENEEELRTYSYTFFD